MIRPMLFVLVLATSIIALQLTKDFTASYGKGDGEVGYSNSGFSDESGQVPWSFYVSRNMVYLDDTYNERVIIINTESGRRKTINQPAFKILYASLCDSVLIADVEVFRIYPRSKRLETIFRVSRKGEHLQHVFTHPSGQIILASNFDRYYLDATWHPRPLSEIPSGLMYDEVLVFKDQRALISDCLSCLRKALSKRYRQFTSLPKGDTIPALYRFPDSTEWGAYFQSSDILFTFLGVDQSYNTYWVTNTKVVKEYEKTYNVIGDKYKDKMQAVFSYDKLGKLRFWFPEPATEEGWKHYGGDIRISPEGRIYQMDFYSLINRPKSEIDTTKGIRIVEYIPDEIDKSHEGRVKRYGQGRK